MNMVHNFRPLPMTVCALVAALSLAVSTAIAVPSGYVQQMIPTEAPPVAMAFDADGLLYVLSGAGFGDNAATMQVFASDGSMETSFPVVGEDAESFFVGGMAYDSMGDRLLVTDNAANGQVYAVGKSGGQTTVASDVPAVAGIVVRGGGEILVSTAPGSGNGVVYEVDRTTGAKTPKMPGLDYGAGLAFDGDDLIVQDSRSTDFRGRLQRVFVASDPAGLQFGAPSEILSGMSSSYGIVLDADGDIFTTGVGGIFNVGGTPPVESLFYNNGGGTNQFATGIAFFPGTAAFEPFAGSEGGVLAMTTDASFGNEDEFVTLFTPALAEDFNADGMVDGADLSNWSAQFGSQAALREQGDADGDHKVDGADFLRWQQASGATTLLPGLAAQARSAGTTLAVPEATTRVLLTIGWIGALAAARSSNLACR